MPRLDINYSGHDDRSYTQQNQRILTKSGLALLLNLTPMIMMNMNSFIGWRVEMTTTVIVIRSSPNV